MNFLTVVGLYLLLAVAPQGRRSLAVDITLPESNDYVASFNLAKSAGLNAVCLTFDWTDIEVQPGTYSNSSLGIANYFYPQQNTDIHLVIRPVSTNQLHFPSDISSLPFDNPQVISRFERVIDYVLIQVPSTRLKTIVLGDEIDGYLGNDDLRWQQFGTFYSALRSYIQAKRPALTVTTEARLDSMIYPVLMPRFAQLLQNTSTIGLSYYPVNADFSVRDLSAPMQDFTALMNAYPSKSFMVFQLGIPSSTTLGSSEQIQADFVAQMFSVWDAYAHRLPLLTFTWMHEISPSVVNAYAAYYGYGPAPFLDFLSTIGLRNWAGSGSDKAAFTALKAAAAARNWTN